jgi:hypothetical protein
MWLVQPRNSCLIRNKRTGYGDHWLASKQYHFTIARHHPRALSVFLWSAQPPVGVDPVITLWLRREKYRPRQIQNQPQRRLSWQSEQNVPLPPHIPAHEARLAFVALIFLAFFALKWFMVLSIS